MTNQLNLTNSLEILENSTIMSRATNNSIITTVYEIDLYVCMYVCMYHYVYVCMYLKFTLQPKAELRKLQ